MRRRSIFTVSAAAFIALVLWRFTAVPANVAAPAAPRNEVEGQTATFVEPARALEAIGMPEENFAARVRQAAAEGASWSALQDLLEELALRNPALALELAEKFGPTDKARYVAMADIVQRWARREPEAALDWSIRQGRRWDAMDASFPFLVLNRVAQSDPGAVIGLAQTTLANWVSRPGTDPSELAYTAVNALLASGEPDLARQAVERWSAASLVEQMGRDALERVASRMADDGSPTEAIAWLQKLPGSEVRSEVTGSMAARWAEQEPTAAAAWVDKLSDQGMRAEALQRVLAAWAEKDFVAAANWLSQRDTDPAADAIWASFAGEAHAVRNDHVTALKFASLVTNAELRASTTDDVLARWHETDPAAVARHIATNSSYPPAEKQRLFAMLGRD